MNKFKRSFKITNEKKTKQSKLNMELSIVKVIFF